MRRVALLACAGMLAASAARAQTTLQQFSVPGLPFDVEIADGGSRSARAWIGVSTDTAYGWIVGTPGSMSVNVPAPTGYIYYSAYVNALGCEELIYNNGGYTYDSVCGNPPVQVLYGTIDRLRHSASGWAYANVTENGPGASLWFGGHSTLVAGGWSSLLGVIPMTPLVSAYQDANVEYGFTVDLSGLPTLVWDGGIPGIGNVSSGFAPIDQASEVSLFKDSQGLAALLATNTGLYLTHFQNGGPSVQMATPVATSLVNQRVTGVSFHTGTGDVSGTISGDGFGMAVTTDGGYSMVYGAVPDPDHPAEYWVPRPEITLDGGPPQLQRVTCNGGVLCAFTADQSTGNNVLVYANRYRPSVASPGGWLLDSQAGYGALNPMAYDQDSDPMFLKWSVDAGVPLSLLATTSWGKDSIYVHPELQCSGNPTARYFLDYSVSDGYGPAVTGLYGVDVQHAVPPADPVIQPDPATYRLAAGSGPTDFYARGGDAGCSPRFFDWTGPVPSGYSFTTSDDGGRMTVTPPATLCQTDAIVYTVQANDGVVASSGKSITFTIDPWGMPETPFPPGAVATQRGDAGVTYTPWTTHVCADAGGFPGVTTQWFLDSSAPVAPEATSSGAPMSSGDFARALTLKFPDCTNEPYVLGARNFLGDAGTSTSYLTIDVNTPMLDLQAANVWLRVDAGAGVVTGELSSDVNCAASRGLQGHFSVQHSLSGMTLWADAGTIPGTYLVLLSTGCSGGDFTAAGWLSDPDGGTSNSATASFRVPQLDAGAALIGSTLAAHCGQSAHGTVAATFPAGTCPLSEVSWSQLDDGSPPLQLVPNGASAELYAGDGGLDGLIGAWVRVRASLDAGLGNVAEEVQPLQIVPDSPFVTLVHDTDAPVAEETGILGVRIRITNETACPVTNVTLHENASGLRYIPGTARLDGAPLEAGATAPELVFDGLSLAAHQTRTLTYSARPALLGSASPKGWATMNGVHVSDTRGLAAPPTGCGCGHSPGEAMAFAAALLAWAARRRLRGRS